MKTLKEELSLSSVSIYEYFVDFPSQFLEYISIFRITLDLDFEIQLKDEYLNSKEIKKGIQDYIKGKYSHLKVIFTNQQLPF